MIALRDAYRIDTPADVQEKLQRMRDHLDRLLAAGQMDKRNYDRSLIELADWAVRKQAGIE